MSTQEIYIPTQVSFLAANRNNFYSYKYTKLIKLLPFGIRYYFFAYDQPREDLLFGTDFLSLIAPFTFYLEGFSYIIVNHIDHIFNLFIILRIEQQFIFRTGDKAKIHSTPVQKFEV